MMLACTVAAFARGRHAMHRQVAGAGGVGKWLCGLPWGPIPLTLDPRRRTNAESLGLKPRSAWLPVSRGSLPRWSRLPKARCCRLHAGTSEVLIACLPRAGVRAACSTFFASHGARAKTPALRCFCARHAVADWQQGCLKRVPPSSCRRHRGAPLRAVPPTAASPLLLLAPACRRLPRLCCRWPSRPS